MKDAPKIKSIIVTLEDGRWQHFTARDIANVRDYAGLCRQWELLQFITELAPPIAEEGVPGSDEKSEEKS